ncbi:MAG: methionyl-tRNA formyltransferase [Waddliaceae bacterium]
MRVVFFGTPPFAAQTLKYLMENGVDVCAIVSRPDRPKGRKQKMMPTAVKEVAAEYPKIPLYQPEKVSTDAFKELLQEHQADLFVVVAFGEILKQSILDIPRLACINVHASLLPKYRGAAPIQTAIIQGEKETGITIMHMVKKMDAGNMIAVKKTMIGPDETFGEVQVRLCTIGCEQLIQVIRQFADEGKIIGTPQDHEAATFAPKIESKDCKIDWSLPALQIHNLVRGVNPYPGAYTDVNVKGEPQRIKIFRTRIVPEETQEPLVISCGEGFIQILELQPPGKKVMKAEDFLRGTPQDQLEFLQ